MKRQAPGEPRGKPKPPKPVPAKLTLRSGAPQLHLGGRSGPRAAVHLVSGPAHLGAVGHSGGPAAVHLHSGPATFALEGDPPFMTTYYVRQTGVDTNAGTSAGAAFRTVGKALSVVAAGDLVYVGGGGKVGIAHYRELLSLTTGGAAVGGAITAMSVSGTTVTVTTTSAHGLVAGQYVFITGAVGNSGVNGVWKLDTASGSSYTFTSAAAGGTWASGGTTQQLVAIIADTDGAKTGDAGEVVLSPYKNGDTAAASTGNATLTLNAISRYAFFGFLFLSSGNTTTGCILGTNTNSQWIYFADCTFLGLQPAVPPVNYTAVVDVPAHWLFDRCMFGAFSPATVAGFKATVPTSTTADYDLDIRFRNCYFANPGIAVQLVAQNANSFKGGGVRLDHCSHFSTGSANAVVISENSCVTKPVLLVNCALLGASELVGVTGSSGTVIEEYCRGEVPYNSQNNLGTASLWQNPSTQVGLLMGVLGAEGGGQRRPRVFGQPAALSTLANWGDTDLQVSSAPTTITDDATVGVAAWQNPSNAGYPDSSRATCPLTTNQDSDYLNFQGMGFTIPSNAVIDGVKVEIFDFGSAGSNFNFSTGSNAGCKLLKAGVIGGSRKTNTSVPSTLQFIHTFGGHDDLWGNTLTPADINNAGFGFVLCVRCTATATMDIDYARMVVYYHLPVPELSTDFFNRPRPAGGNLPGTSGTATSGAAATITDSGATWGIDQWLGWVVVITGGTGSGQYKPIQSNTATALSVSSNWATNPDATSTYVVYYAGGNHSETGKATSATATTLSVSNAAWHTNQWVGYTLELTGGTGSGQKGHVVSNTGTALTIGYPGSATIGQGNQQWVTTPDSTTTYALYRGMLGAGGAGAAVGCMERHDTAVEDTAHADSGSCWAITGPGDHELEIAVDATAYTLSVKVRTDGSSGFGSGFEPQAEVLANPAIGVVDEVQTSVSPGTSYQTLTFTAFTPTAKGRVKLRLRNRTATAYATCYFDTVAGV